MFRVLVLGVLVWQQIIQDTSGQPEDGTNGIQQENLPELTSENSTGDGIWNFLARQQIFFINQLPPTFSAKQLDDLPTITQNTGGLISAQNVNGEMRYHKFNSSLVSWNSARTQCIKEGGNLAVIRSETEAEKLYTMFPDDESIKGAWVGYHDKFEEGDWTTVLGEPTSSLGWFKWTTKFNSPDNYEQNQHCAQLLRSGGLDDYTCEKVKAFICERIV